MIGLDFLRKKGKIENEAIVKRTKDIIQRIHEEYPEITVQDTGGQNPSTAELVRIYYELKMMESQKLRDTITKILMIFNLIVVAILGYLSYVKVI